MRCRRSYPTPTIGGRNCQPRGVCFNKWVTASRGSKTRIAVDGYRRIEVYFKKSSSLRLNNEKCRGSLVNRKNTAKIGIVNDRMFSLITRRANEDVVMEESESVDIKGSKKALPSILGKHNLFRKY